VKQKFFSLIARNLIAQAGKVLVEEMKPLFPDEQRESRFNDFSALAIQGDKLEKAQEWISNRKNILTTIFDTFLENASQIFWKN